MMFRSTVMAAMAALCLGFASSPAMSTPVLDNAGFENTVQPSFGNNIGASVAPWVSQSGQPNVVRVDGPGGGNYGNAGPESDAALRGSGVVQHYLDMTNGQGEVYQEFVPLCSGTAVFGGYFSTRGNAGGTARVSIGDASGAPVFGPATVTVPSAASQFAPWSMAAFNATLTAGTPYRFSMWMDNQLNFDEAFVDFFTDCPDHTPSLTAPKIETGKTCDVPYETADGMAADCSITVSYDSKVLNVVDVSLQDSLSVDGTPSNLSFGALQAPPGETWTCALTTSDTTPLTCGWNFADMPPPPAGAHSSSFVTTVNLPSAGDWDVAHNCVTAKLTVSAGGEDEAFAIETGEVCAEITAPEVSDDTDDDTDNITTGATCSIFDYTLECGAEGQPVVVLSNSVDFDPTALDFSVVSPATVTPSPVDRLRILLDGAAPGDKITLALDAVETAGGSLPGLDLCCLGELDVTIPKDWVCEPPKSTLEITKSCTASGLTEGGDTRCDIFVDYSGPAPTNNAPLSVVDDSTPPLIIQSVGWPLSSDPPADHFWQCPSTPQGTPFACTLAQSNVAQTPPADWKNFSSVYEVYFDAPETWRNCASGTAPDGAAAEGCFQKGDFELVLSKRVPEGSDGVCIPGQACPFEIVVGNIGTQDYTGALTLLDVPQPGGQITAINTLPGCDPAELTIGGCTGSDTVPAGGETTYLVDYVLPVGTEPGSYENCVYGRDESMALDAPDHESCVRFVVEPPRLKVSKTQVGACAPGAPCTFDLAFENEGNSDFSGPVALYEQMFASGGVVTGFTPMPPECSLADPFQCVTQVDLAAGQSMNWSVTAEFGNYFVGDEVTRNCFYVARAREGEPLGNLSSAAAQAYGKQDLIGHQCVQLTPPDDTLDLAMEKTGQAIAGTNQVVFRLHPVLRSGTLRPGDVLMVTDALLSQYGLTPQQVIPASGWNCNGANNVTCNATIGSDGAMPGPIEITAVFEGEGWRNCARIRTPRDLKPENDKACATGSVVAAAPEPPVLSVRKTCSDLSPDDGSMREFTCNIQVVGGNIPAGETITLSDIMTLANGSAATGVFLTNAATSDGWDCPPDPGTECTINSDALGANFVSTIDITGVYLNDAPDDLKNCAEAELSSGYRSPQTEGSCDMIEDGDDDVVSNPWDPAYLTLSKSALGDCEASRARQSYRCDFEFTVTNSGNFAFDGAVNVQDRSVAGPNPSKVQLVEGGSWSCSDKGCFTRQLRLAPGASERFVLQMTLPALRSGGEYCNAAQLGLPEDRRTQVYAVQEAMRNFGIDGGPSDGKSGPKTRRGVSALQEQFGLPVTGELSAELLAALGLAPQEGAVPAQACVNLVPISAPPLQCDAKTTTQLGDFKCGCKYRGMIPTSQTACQCPSGTELRDGACRKVICSANLVATSSGKCVCPSGLKWNGSRCVEPVTCGANLVPNAAGKCVCPSGTSYQGGRCVKPLGCDRRSTVQSGNSCVCREGFSQRVSRTKCVKPPRIDIKKGDGDSRRVCVEIAGVTQCLPVK